jgi:hypothetical protein
MKNLEEDKRRTIEELKENLYTTNLKLKPIEDSFTFQSKSHSSVSLLLFTFVNTILILLILLMASLNCLQIYKKIKGVSLNFSNENFKSPIDSILPEDITKGKFAFN